MPLPSEVKVKVVQEECRGDEAMSNAVVVADALLDLSNRNSARTGLALALIELAVGSLQQVLRGAPIVRVYAHPDADPERRLFPSILKRASHSAGNVARHSRIGVDQQNCELVSTVACSEIGDTTLLLHHVREPF